MKELIGLFVMLIIGVLLLSYGLKGCGDDLVTEIEKYEERVGDKVILNNDTLMIIDYSFMNSNFTLEDGREISIDLLDKIECVGENKTTTKAD